VDISTAQTHFTSVKQLVKPIAQEDVQEEVTVLTTYASVMQVSQELIVLSGRLRFSSDEEEHL